MMRRQSGFAYIAAVIFLVVIAGISLALLRLTDTQQSTVNQSLMAARANLAARAAIEWAAHDPEARCGPGATPVVNDLGDFRSEAGFLVRVSCGYLDFDEVAAGENKPGTKRVYTIDATACNGSASTCPDDNSVARADYVERRRVATICLARKAGPPVEFTDC